MTFWLMKSKYMKILITIREESIKLLEFRYRSFYQWIKRLEMPWFVIYSVTQKWTKSIENVTMHDRTSEPNLLKNGTTSVPFPVDISATITVLKISRKQTTSHMIIGHPGAPKVNTRENNEQVINCLCTVPVLMTSSSNNQILKNLKSFL